MLTHVLKLYGIGTAAAFVAVAAVGFGAGHKYKSRVASWVGTIAVSLSVSIFIQFISIPFGPMLASHDIEEAKKYCEYLVPRLNDHKLKTGSYPTDVNEVIPWWKPRPRLLENRFYLSDGQDFEFDFPDPRGFTFNIFIYHRERMEWELIED